MILSEDNSQNLHLLSKPIEASSLDILPLPKPCNELNESLTEKIQETSDSKGSTLKIVPIPTHIEDKEKENSAQNEKKIYSQENIKLYSPIVSENPKNPPKSLEKIILTSSSPICDQTNDPINKTEFTENVKIEENTEKNNSN